MEFIVLITLPWMVLTLKQAKALYALVFPLTLSPSILALLLLEVAPPGAI
jgi:hypothetical protein